MSSLISVSTRPARRQRTLTQQALRVSTLALTLYACVDAYALNAQAPTETAMCDGAANNNAAMKATVQGQIAAKPGTALADFLRGCLLMGEDKNDKAAEQFENATKKEPAKSLYFDWLGRAYGEQAQNANKLRQPFLAKKTKSAWEQAVKLDPNNLDARSNLIQYYQQAPGFLGGSEEKATEEAEAIRARNPYRGALVMSSVKQRRKDLAGAEKEVVALTKSYPDSLAPWYNVISMELNAKRWADAFKTAEELRAAHPDLHTNDYQVGRIAALSGEQLDRGETSLRKYLTYTPQQNEPQHANAHFRLGQILQKRGNNEGAKAEFREAVKLQPNFEDAKKALAAMK